MKKSIIWILIIIMSLTFGTLLYFQIMYLEKMVSMREAEFSESVRRAMYATAGYLEREETLQYLKEDVLALEDSFYDETYLPDEQYEQNIEPYDSVEGNFVIASVGTVYDEKPGSLLQESPTQGIPERFSHLQESIKNQYRYQRRLLNEVILTIMRESGSRPIFERADSTVIKNSLKLELAHNGLDVPFEFAIANDKGIIQYSTSDYTRDSVNEKLRDDTYTQGLFSTERPTYILSVVFPTKGNYVFSSVRFIIPTLAFTVILLVVFVYTIILAFRQKKLTEMKSDFINNMTHEFKTPISTISLAAQMLNDDSVKKAPSLLQNISKVITEETKRLRMQVERVLVLSMLDHSQMSVKYSEVDANDVVENVVHTFKLRVEKSGGSISCDCRAPKASLYVDEMHFTNMIFTLLDNAVKYRREDESLRINVNTEDSSDGNYLLVKVKDNGIGIRKEDQKRIFERFYRVSTGNHHDVKGFGIGLSYVKQMARQFGGTVRVESEPGKGTTFILSLPLLSESTGKN